MSISDRLKHFFHVVSNIRPIVWIGLYIALVPVFAVIYNFMPDGQFRIPDGGTTDFGSWLYYSIVTITTLGFGDYTPMMPLSQCVTAVEVMCGLIILGLFLNAVGSMKSEIDITSEIEKQRMLHEAAEKQKIVKSTPTINHLVDSFLIACYAVTTPSDKQSDNGVYTPGFTISDMRSMYKPSAVEGLPSGVTPIEALLRSASRLSLALDSMQTRIDLTPWDELLEDAFGFVANYQMFSSADSLVASSSSAISDALDKVTSDNDVKSEPELAPVVELASFIRENAAKAESIMKQLSDIGSQNS